jgi:hypothetical protein
MVKEIKNKGNLCNGGMREDHNTRRTPPLL